MVAPYPCLDDERESRVNPAAVGGRRWPHDYGPLLLGSRLLAARDNDDYLIQINFTCLARGWERSSGILVETKVKMSSSPHRTRHTRDIINILKKSNAVIQAAKKKKDSDFCSNCKSKFPTFAGIEIQKLPNFIRTAIQILPFS